jgi:hypothetical protein
MSGFSANGLLREPTICAPAMAVLDALFISRGPRHPRRLACGTGKRRRAEPAHQRQTAPPDNDLSLLPAFPPLPPGLS